MITWAHDEQILHLPYVQSQLNVFLKNITSQIYLIKL